MRQSLTKKPRTSEMKAKRLGFTLIELLVVIAIIAILAAILFPVFARARENARRTSCLSNAKQLGLGFMQYTQDYDEMYPIIGYALGDTVVYPSGQTSNNSWILRVYPYVKSVQIFTCPSNTIPPWQGGTSPSAVAGTSYGASSALLTNGLVPTALAAVQKVSDTVLLADSAGTAAYMINQTYSSTRYVTDRHLEGANFCFADGHAKWKKMSRNAADEPVHPTAVQGVYWRTDGIS